MPPPDGVSLCSSNASGIANFLEKAGTLEVAQRIAGDADSRTTELYDRREQKICSSRRSEFAIKIDMRSSSGGSEEREISNW
jgi:hypothetical protein